MKKRTDFMPASEEMQQLIFGFWLFASLTILYCMCT